MGSLMAGWDSPVPDPKTVKYRKNWSFTKGEIEAYWRLKKKIEEEHLKDISSPPKTIREEGPYQEYGMKFARSSSLPITKTKDHQGFMDMETEASLEQLIKKNGWWTRSNWAFLNEPPVLERPTNSYTSQYHVANLANAKANTGLGA